MMYEAVKQDHLPKGKKRQGKAMVAQFITVHNTGNPTSTAANERVYLSNPANTNSTAYHIVVDANQAIEAIPLNEVAYHAGDGANGSGNTTSIGIEICESGDYKANEQAAVELIADMLKLRGWGVDRIRAHKDWSGKGCPRLILPHWESFIGRISAEMNQEEVAEVRYKKLEDVPSWGRKTIEKLITKGFLSGNSAGEINLSEDMVRMIVVNDRAGLYGA